MSAWLRWGCAALALTLVAACSAPVAPRRAAAPAATPATAAVIETDPAATGRSAAVRQHYASLEAQHAQNGLLRTDGGGADAPISRRMLEEAFVRIALYDEYLVQNGAFIARQRPARLRRWQEPVRIGLTFGPSVPAAQRSRDRAAVAALASDLARASRHPVMMDQARPNLHVQILSEDERRNAAADWAALLPGTPADVLGPAAEMGLDTVCLALAFTPRDTAVYGQALIIVRAELPDLLRVSCFHEEIAQALGLVNDWSRARPSIFNDDEEFATLTQLDVLLLRILYDPRLSPGMREAEVRPILRQISAELLPSQTP